jgi:homoserine kinase
LHQRYRASLFPEAEILLSGLVASGALASSWSGAGPSIVAIGTVGTASRIAEAGAKLLADSGLSGQVLQLAPDFGGVQTTQT